MYNSGSTHEVLKIAGRSFTFQINEKSFFRINSKATELLCSKIVSLCKEFEGEKNTKISILDLYSGVGVLGISIACTIPSAQVIGVDKVKESALDALNNVKINNTNNVEILNVCNKKELNTILSKLVFPSLIILDAPPTGIHPSILRRICNHKKIERIVIIGKPSACLDKAIPHLCKDFEPIKCYIFDLNPQTPQQELILVLNRITNNSSTNK